VLTAINLLKRRKLVTTGDPIVIISDVLHDDLIVDSILLRVA
jgi:pyruvate kinase